MLLRYETKHLILLPSDECFAPLTLEYRLRNKEDFAQWDSMHSEEFYTLDFQREMLRAEQSLLLRGQGVRFYSFLKDDPDMIIGNISFAYLNEDYGHRSTIGYRTDKDHRRCGYAFEAASCLIPEVASTYQLKRIEADILPENQASRALIEKLGFEYEGIARSSHEINGKERDHLRFSLIPKLT